MQASNIFTSKYPTLIELLIDLDKKAINLRRIKMQGSTLLYRLKLEELSA